MAACHPPVSIDVMGDLDAVDEGYEDVSRDFFNLATRVIKPVPSFLIAICVTRSCGTVWMSLFWSQL